MHNVFTKAKGLSMAQELSDSVRSLDGKSTDGKITPGPMRSTNTPSITPNPLGDGPSGASGDGPEDGEMMHLLKSLLSESKAQANMIRMLMSNELVDYLFVLVIYSIFNCLFSRNSDPGVHPVLLLT